MLRVSVVVGQCDVVRLVMRDPPKSSSCEGMGEALALT